MNAQGQVSRNSTMVDGAAAPGAPASGWQRAEGLAILLTAVAVYGQMDVSWLLFVGASRTHISAESG